MAAAGALLAPHRTLVRIEDVRFAGPIVVQANEEKVAAKHHLINRERHSSNHRLCISHENLSPFPLLQST